jgi:hypothetical protein
MIMEVKKELTVLIDLADISSQVRSKVPRPPMYDEAV